MDLGIRGDFIINFAYLNTEIELFRRTYRII